LQDAELAGTVLTNVIFSNANLQHVQAGMLEFFDVDLNNWHDVLVGQDTAVNLGIAVKI
jgi:uncharacterized protein YjbI with pentapeptide repeats